MASHERGAAYRIFSAQTVPTVRGHDYPSVVSDLEHQLRARLGELGPSDAYFLPMSQPCDSFLGDPATLAAFFHVLPRTRTFITNARWDGVVYTKALPHFLGLELDGTLPEGAARPGVLRGDGVQIRFPSYDAGHMVTMGAPGELREDVFAWLEAEGALAQSAR